MLHLGRPRGFHLSEAHLFNVENYLRLLLIYYGFHYESRSPEKGGDGIYSKDYKPPPVQQNDQLPDPSKYKFFLPQPNVVWLSELIKHSGCNFLSPQHITQIDLPVDIIGNQYKINFSRMAPWLADNIREFFGEPIIRQQASANPIDLVICGFGFDELEKNNNLQRAYAERLKSRQTEADGWPDFDPARFAHYQDVFTPALALYQKVLVPLIEAGIWVAIVTVHWDAILVRQLLAQFVPEAQLQRIIIITAPTDHDTALLAPLAKVFTKHNITVQTTLFIDTVEDLITLFERSKYQAFKNKFSVVIAEEPEKLAENLFLLKTKFQLLFPKYILADFQPGQPTRKLPQPRKIKSAPPSSASAASTTVSRPAPPPPPPRLEIPPSPADNDSEAPGASLVALNDEVYQLSKIDFSSPFRCSVCNHNADLASRIVPGTACTESGCSGKIEFFPASNCRECQATSYFADVKPLHCWRCKKVFVAAGLVEDKASRASTPESLPPLLSGQNFVTAQSGATKITFGQAPSVRQFVDLTSPAAYSSSQNNLSDPNKIFTCPKCGNTQQDFMIRSDNGQVECGACNYVIKLGSAPKEYTMQCVDCANRGVTSIQLVDMQNSGNATCLGCGGKEFRIA